MNFRNSGFDEYFYMGYHLQHLKSDCSANIDLKTKVMNEFVQTVAPHRSQLISAHASTPESVWKMQIPVLESSAAG